MCAITGIFHLHDSRAIDRELLARMIASQHHRGPDGGGSHCEPGLGLGHRRLSIIDREGGMQPLSNEDHNVIVVYNGEIYNFKALSDELQQFGHIFRTHCDTEVIVHAWEQWGERCVERFRGMFAFALWDRRQQTLFLARDRLGVKPLHYALLDDGTFLFGSELKSLSLHPDFQRSLSPQAIEEYFAFGYIPDPHTIYRQAHKLPPGHCLRLRRGGEMPAPRRYWDVPFIAAQAGSNFQVADELIERLREAVRIRLISEVPLGAFLSGGVDSSAVVAMMAQCMEQAVDTCSISFGDPDFNEAGYARVVAQRYLTRHHEQQVDQDDYGLIDTLAAVYDEPFADSSAMPTYRLCQLARQRVTVALSGDGGDENLAGYRRYRWHMHEDRLRSVLPLALRQRVFGMLGHVYPKADWAPRPLRAKTTFQALARDSVSAYFHSIALMNDSLRQQLYSAEFKHQLDGYHALEVLRGHANSAPARDGLSLIQYLDLKTYLPGDILTKVDRASMAHGLEVRVPLLDHQLVEWLSGLPPHFKLNGGHGKYIFKRALQPYLPAEILYRRKMGFSVPLAGWLRGPLRHSLHQMLSDSALASCGLFEPSTIRTLIERHTNGRSDHSAPLWSLLMFNAFLGNSHAHPAHT
jgi:asparagine synthase (glutamine-hydrolysing)